MTRAPILSTLTVLACACGTGSTQDVYNQQALGPQQTRPTDGAPDGGSGEGQVSAEDAGGAFSPASHQPFELIASQGGPVLGPLNVVSVYFDGGYASGSIEQGLLDFDEWAAGSSWLTTVGAEYGVSAGRRLAAVDLGPAPAEVDDADIVQLVTKLTAAGTYRTNSNPPLFVFHFPASTQVSSSSTEVSAGGAALCSAAGGYHAEAAIGDPTPYPYAVIPDCAPAASSASALADAEARASREIIEGATDPFPTTAPAWIDSKSTTQPWSAYYGEVGDACEGNAFQDDAGYTVQRVWSNAAAETGGDPCVPYPANELYYGVSSQPTGVLTVKAGSTTDITLTGWSTSERSSWSVLPFMGARQDFCPVLGGVFDGGGCNDWNAFAAMNNGVEATFRVTVPAGVDAGAVASLVLQSYGGAQSGDALWPLQIVVE